MKDPGEGNCLWNREALLIRCSVAKSCLTLPPHRRQHGRQPRGAQPLRRGGWLNCPHARGDASIPIWGLSQGPREHPRQCLAAGASYPRTNQDPGRGAAHSRGPTTLFQNRGLWPSSQLEVARMRWITRPGSPELKADSELPLKKLNSPWVKAEAGWVRGEGVGLGDSGQIRPSCSILQPCSDTTA